MASFQSEPADGGTWPDWADGEQALMLRVEGGRVRVRWRDEGKPRPSAWIARWLEERVRMLPAAELSADEQYAIVVLGADPLGDEHLGEVGGGSPVVRFGFGDSWSHDSETMPLQRLLEGAIRTLRLRRGDA